MCVLIIFSFIFLFFAELSILIKIGEQMGVSYTMGILFFTALLGCILSRIEGYRVFKKINEELAKGVMPGKKIIDGFLIVVGAILLIIPGVLTDILGFLMILPGIRILFRELTIYIIKKNFFLNFNVNDVENIVDVSDFAVKEETNFGIKDRIQIVDESKIIDAEIVSDENETEWK